MRKTGLGSLLKSSQWALQMLKKAIKNIHKKLGKKQRRSTNYSNEAKFFLSFKKKELAQMTF